MTKREAFNGKPYARNPHVRFDEGKVASTATPRRGSLLYKTTSTILTAIRAVFVAAVAASAALPMSATADNVTWTGTTDQSLLNANNWTNAAEEAVLPGTTDTALIGDEPEANLSNGSATYAHLKLGTENGKTGTLTVGNGGTLTVTEKTGGALAMGNVGGSSGVLNIDGGEVTIESLNTPNCAATSTINLRAGTLKINDWADWGRNANGRAEFNQSGGTLNLTKGLQIGRENNGTGVYNMSGGVLNGASGDVFMVGCYSGCTGTFNLTGDDATVNFGYKTVHIGGAYNNQTTSKGYFNQSAGTVTTKGNLQIGTYGVGAYTQTGGSLTCGDYFSIGRYAGSSGTYTITDGTFSTTQRGVFIGEEGTGTMTVGGKGVVTINGGVYIGGKSGSKGSLYLKDNGKIVTDNIYKGAGTVSAVEFNGGTLEARKDTDVFLANLGSIQLDAGGVEIDSAGHDIGVSGCDFDEVVGARFGKAGEGTLTLAAMPPADTVAVDGGTLALSADGDNASACLAHRWSFTSSLSDSITGKSGENTGTISYVTDTTSGSTALRLPGANNGKCFVNLGAKKLPSDSVTVEAWVTMRNIVDWVRVFLIQDGVTQDTSHSLAFISRTSDTGLDSAGTSKYTGSALQKDVQYYVAITISPNGKGGSVTRWYIKKVGDTNFLFKNEATNNTWTVSANMATDPSNGHFWLGRSDYNDKDATADYDEVRVWNGTLDEEAIALSAAKGPDATSEDIAEIVAAGTTASRTLSVASGATLDLGGNTLMQPVLDVGGTLANGNLVVSKRLVVTPGQTMTVASGATLDLSAVTEVALKDASATIPAGGWAIASGEIALGGETRKEIRLTGALRGYTLFLTTTKAWIGRHGLIISVH